MGEVTQYSGLLVDEDRVGDVPLDETDGGIVKLYAGSTALDLGSIAAGAVGTGTIAIPAGAAKTGDPVVVTAEDLDTGLVLESAEITSDDELTVRVLNTSGGSIDPASTNFHWIIFKGA